MYMYEDGGQAKMFIACHLSNVQPQEISIASTQIKAMEITRGRKVSKTQIYETKLIYHLI